MLEKSNNSSTPGAQPPPSGLRWLSAVLLLVLFAGLASAIMSLPVGTSGLRGEVAAELTNSGVSHSVTAVLLNFRGYDTLLEMAVLLLALIGVWSLAPAKSPPLTAPGSVLERLVELYVPLMLLTAGYLLWNGAHAPGGAFQGGAVLAAAAVLMFLSGRSLPASLEAWPFRSTIALGLIVFTAVAAFLAWQRGALLDYPPAAAGVLILVIETTATVSIGAILAALFLGGRPGMDDESGTAIAADDTKVSAVTPWQFYSLLGVGLFSLALYTFIVQAHLLRKILAFNIMGSSVFLVLAGLAGSPEGEAPDPVPHAMVITGIVVAVSATALALVLMLRLRDASGSITLPEDKGD